MEYDKYNPYDKYNEDNYIDVTNILKIIIIFFFFVMLLGFCIAAYYADFRNYLSSVGSGPMRVDGYDIKYIDETDIKYLKMFVPEKTLDDVAKMISDNIYVSDPNRKIEDSKMINPDKNLGSDMPWDRDVKPCEILKNTDQDLYADVQNARKITIY